MFVLKDILSIRKHCFRCMGELNYYTYPCTSKDRVWFSGHQGNMLFRIETYCNEYKGTVESN